jgi:hypothetical protein
VIEEKFAHENPGSRKVSSGFCAKKKCTPEAVFPLRSAKNPNAE